jgi:MPBQ/MSBQ methyltransferase
MDVSDLVRGYYGADDSLSATILGALASAGIDVEHLQLSDLALVDHLHAGGVPATRHLLDRLDVGPKRRLLDVGSGFGGPSRMAALTGATVTGVDLTREFVEAATELTARVGLDGNPRYVVAPAEALPFENETFDAG